MRERCDDFQTTLTQIIFYLNTSADCLEYSKFEKQNKSEDSLC